MKRIILTFLILFTYTNSIFAQTVNDIPLGNKKYIKGTSLTLASPNPDYFREKAITDSELALNPYKKAQTDYNREVNRINSRNQRKALFIEGLKEVVSSIPVVGDVFTASSGVAKIGESLYWKEKRDKIYKSVETTDNTENTESTQERKNFETSVKNSFEAYTKKSIANQGSVTFEENLAGFSEEIKKAETGLNAANYQIIAPQIHKQIVEFIRQDRNDFETKFQSLKNETQTDVAVLEAELENKLNQLKKDTTEYDKAILNKVSEYAGALNKFGEKVNEKLAKQDADMAKMSEEITDNKQRLDNNEAEIKTIKSRVTKTENDIKTLNKLTSENRALINENSYKIDVITDVLYDNVNTSGKKKLLDMRYKNDPTNNKYIKEKERLDNIETVEKIKNTLAVGEEVVQLASNLGLSPQDARRANKALEIGNVLANGAMAYFTGNPLAGLQAINGAFAVFGGGNSQPNPEFTAIMEQFKIVNQKLDEINRKIDVLQENLTELRNLTIDFHIENQRRFDEIEERLVKIQTGINNITGFIYAREIGGLVQENIESYGFLWREIQIRNSLKDLKQTYQDAPKLKNIIAIVYNNTENRSLSTKPFLHYTGYDYGNEMEDIIYKPMLELTTALYPNLSFDKLEISIDYIKDFPELRNSSQIVPNNDIFPMPSRDVNKLIYPQSLITLTEFMNLLEPYYYFSSSGDNNFNIADESVLQNINYTLKNNNLKTQYLNLLKENRTAILQTNIISGVPLLGYFHKHLTDTSFDKGRKTGIYKMLNSDNYYLKVNLSNYILYNYISQQELYADKLRNILDDCTCEKTDEKTDCACPNVEKYDELLKDFNNHFGNQFYELSKVKVNEQIQFVLKIKPSNITGIDESKNEILLPLPPFKDIYENRVIYPGYLEHLHLNEEKLINKVVKYDVVERIKDEKFSETFKDFRLLH